MSVYKLTKKEMNLKPETINMTIRDGRSPVIILDKGNTFIFSEGKIIPPENNVLLATLKKMKLSPRIVEKTQRDLYPSGNYIGKKYRIFTDGKKTKYINPISQQPMAAVEGATYIVAYFGNKEYTYAIWHNGSEDAIQSVLKFIR
jgi:hypothetical protein